MRRESADERRVVEHDPGEVAQARRRAGRKETIRDTPLVEHLDGAGLHPGRTRPVLAAVRALFEQDHVDPPRRSSVARVKPVGPAPATMTGA